MTQIYRPMIADRHGHAGERERWFKPNCPLLSKRRKPNCPLLSPLLSRTQMTVDDVLQRNGTGAEVGIPGVMASIDLCRGDALRRPVRKDLQVNDHRPRWLTANVDREWRTAMV